MVSSLEYTIDTRFQMWMWGGRLHMVLQGWTLSSTHNKDMWNLWQLVTSLSRLLGCAILKKLDLHNNTAETAQITLRRAPCGCRRAA
jgi:hypothetical protein